MRVWSVPMRTRFRGIAVREGVLSDEVARVNGDPDSEARAMAEAWKQLGTDILDTLDRSSAKVERVSLERR